MPERKVFTRRGSRVSVFSRFCSLFRASTRSLPRVRARLYVCHTRVIFARTKGRRLRADARAHARSLESRWFRSFAGSSFLRATDAPIRARVSFVIRENVNQSLLAAARPSVLNLPRGPAFLFVGALLGAALFGPSRTAICRVCCG